MVQVPHSIRDSLESLQLPSIPQILLKFLSLSEDNTATMPALAELVGQDPALSARVLTVANSAALRRGKPITSLAQCMVTLGTRLSRTLAACLVIQNVFSSSSLTDRYDLSGFWTHGLRVADLCRALAEQHQYPDPEEAYLAGLLHDVGQLLLLGGMEERYSILLATSRDETMLRLHEEQRLDTDHAVIGAWLIDRWGFSSSFMADAVLFHHADADEIAAADPLSRILWSAHLICQHQRLYQNGQSVTPPEFNTTQELFGIDFAAAAQLHQQTAERVALLAEALGVTCPDDKRTLPLCSVPLDAAAPRLSEAESPLSPAEEAVRTMALLKPLQQDLSAVQSEEELYLAAQESARILFGLGSVAFLALQQEQRRLQGAAGCFQPELLQQLSISLDSGSSLAAAACLDGIPRCTLQEEERPLVALTDLQIARIMKTEGLLYLPMPGRAGMLGVMVCGLSASHARRLLRCVSSLAGFARAAAEGIETWRHLQAAAADREERATRQLELQARKIAHEAGNPLGIIRNYLSIMSSKVPDDAGIGQELDILKEEIERVSQILRGMGNLAEAARSEQTVAVNSMIESLLAIYRASLFENRGIHVHLELDPELPSVDTSRDSLKQILFNLWNNASDALQPGATLTVSTRAGFIFDGRSCIEIDVTDTGPGLPADVQQQLFTPLASNRRPGHAGLGLSIVAELVQQLHGRITCRSKTGSGTGFSILLPVHGASHD